jgi:arsenite methyltransferase
MNWVEIRAGMLNSRAKKDSDQVIKKLKIQKGDFIADVSSGGGYLTFEFAKKTRKSGKVFGGY